jgi:hypothetical protein
MKHATFYHKSILAGLAVALLFGLLVTPQPALAVPNDIKVTFVHAIAGPKISLSRGMPVDVRILKNGNLFDTLANLKFRTRIVTELRVNTYTFQVYSREQGKVISSLTLNASDLKPGQRLVIRLTLDASNTPVMAIRKR